MDFNSLNKTPSPLVRKSISSLNVTFDNPVCTIRESLSLTDCINNVALEQRCQAYFNNQDTPNSSHENVREYPAFRLWTRPTFSYEPYFVSEKMLTFQGRRYSSSDIAKLWKKDCRMWLWKNKAGKQKRSENKKVKRNMKKRSDRLTKLFGRLNLNSTCKCRKLRRKNFR